MDSRKREKTVRTWPWGRRGVACRIPRGSALFLGIRRDRASREAFTLLELLVVVVVISILATLALGKFSSARERGALAAMASDLKNLALHQELHHGSVTRYASSLGFLEGYSMSDDVYFTGGGLTVTGTGQGWAARVGHRSASGLECEIFVGDHPPGSIAVEPDSPSCESSGS